MSEQREEGRYRVVALGANRWRVVDGYLYRGNHDTRFTPAGVICECDGWDNALKVCESLTADRDGHHDRVSLMMRRFGQTVRSKPEFPNPDERVRIIKLIFEEAFETAYALGVRVLEDYAGELLHADLTYDGNVEDWGEWKPELDKVADGLADLSVVVNCGMAACGLPARKLLRMVDENNLDKVGKGHLDPVSGKFIKPEDHEPPDIAGLLESEGWKRGE